MPTRLSEIIKETEIAQASGKPRSGMRLSEAVAATQSSSPQESRPGFLSDVNRVANRAVDSALFGLPSAMAELSDRVRPTVVEGVTRALGREPKPIPSGAETSKQRLFTPQTKAGQIAGGLADFVGAVAGGPGRVTASVGRKLIPKGAKLGKRVVGGLAQGAVAGAVTPTDNFDDVGQRAANIGVGTIAGAGFEAAAPAITKPVVRLARRARLKKLLSERADRSLSTIERAASKIGSKSEKLKSQFVDRFAPVANLVDATEKAVGVKVVPAKNPFQAARLYAGIPGRINARMRQYGELLKPLSGELDDLSRVLVSERNAELVSQGRGLAKGARIKLRSGKIVPVQTLDDLTQELGPERAAQLQEIAAKLTQFNNKELLADAVDAGIISQAGAQRMIQRNQKFIPFETLETLADDLLDQGGIRFGRQSFQVAKQDQFKVLEGGARILNDPLLRQAERIYKITTLAERNRVGRAVVEMRALGEGADQFIKILKPKQRPPKNFNEFVVFQDGVPTKYAIPTPVADSLKGLTQEAVDYITRSASLMSRAFRAGATTFSLGFALTNPIRDFQQAKLVARAMGVPFNSKTWMRGLFESVRRGDLFDEFERSLGSFGGFFRGGASVGAGQTPAQALKQIAPTKGQRVTRIATTAVNPAKWIQSVGEAFELAPRLAVFREAKKAGQSAAQAAFAARNSTIDFSRMGTAMKLVNMWVPFLNARLQGTINSLNAVKKNPLGSSYVLSSIVVAPQVATFWWNTSQFPEVWAEIPQWEKDNNFIFIYGDETDNTAPRPRFTQVLKVPKGDMGRVFGNPIENALVFLSDRDPKAVEEVALQILSDVSPIGFERDGEFSGQRALGEILPPAVESAEQLTNPKAVNRFTGFPVVPRRLQEVSPELRAHKNTSETLKRVARTPAGRKLRVSPIQSEAAIRSSFATGGQTLLNVADRILFGQKKRRGGVGRRFVSASGGADQERLIQRAIALRQRDLDARERVRQEADALLVQLQETVDPGQRMNILMAAKQRDPKIVDRLRRAAEDQNRGITTLDRILRTMSVRTRADFISERLNQLPAGGARAQFLREMNRKKLLTKAVRGRLKAIAAQKGLDVAIPEAQAQAGK